MVKVKCDCGRIIGLDTWDIRAIKDGVMFLKCPNCSKEINKDNIKTTK